MEITLEKIELVKDRTGVSYKEAKEALEQTEGNVVDAIIYIEDNIDAGHECQAACKVEEFKNFIAESVRQGNVNRIKVYKGEELLLNLPLTAGIVGLVLFRWWGIIAAVVATGATKCRIELVKEDGSVIDITDRASDALATVKDKGGVIADELQDKTIDFYVAAKNMGQDLYEVAKDKGQNIYETVKDTATDIFAKKGEEEEDTPEEDAQGIEPEEGTEEKNE